MIRSRFLGVWRWDLAREFVSWSPGALRFSSWCSDIWYRRRNFPGQPSFQVPKSRILGIGMVSQLRCERPMHGLEIPKSQLGLRTSAERQGSTMISGDGRGSPGARDLRGAGDGCVVLKRLLCSMGALITHLCGIVSYLLSLLGKEAQHRRLRLGEKLAGLQNKSFETTRII